MQIFGNTTAIGEQAQAMAKFGSSDAGQDDDPYEERR